MGAFRLRLERRPEAVRAWRLAVPALAVLALLAAGAIALRLLGVDPLAVYRALFVEPLASRYGLGEWLLRATPLMLCALGLAPGYRAGIWNLGAEGQLTLGAIAGGGLGIALGGRLGVLALPAMLAAGILAGMAWAAIPAYLRTRLRTPELLVSLMLVYVAELMLSYLVHGPWRDPAGHNFPTTPPLPDAALLPILAEGTRLNAGLLLALALALAAFGFERATHAAFRLRVAGLAPAAARYAGISERRNVWIAMLLGGGAAGLAGVLEVAGPLGMLQPVISPGYGFTAILVAFVGGLRAQGIVVASLLMSALYLGGESAQLEFKLPAAVGGLFQGVVLLFLLAAEVFIHYRPRLERRVPA
jgi:simple sugar transport system permease protein